MQMPAQQTCTTENLFIKNVFVNMMAISENCILLNTENHSCPGHPRQAACDNKLKNVKHILFQLVSKITYIYLLVFSFAVTFNWATTYHRADVLDSNMSNVNLDNNNI